MSETRGPELTTCKAVSTRDSRSSATDRPEPQGFLPAGIAGDTHPTKCAVSLPRTIRDGYLPAETVAGPFFSLAHLPVVFAVSSLNTW